MKNTDIDWIPQLYESRLFRSSTALSKRNAEEIKNIAYLYFCALTIMREEFDTGVFVQDYFTDTFAKGMMFKHVMKADTDLYWALYIIHNNKADLLDPKKQEENEFELERISLPISQMKIYVKNSIKGTGTVAMSRSFFMSLTKQLRITNADYKNLGMLSANWLNLGNQQRSVLCTRLLYALKKHARISEIYPEFEDFVKNKKFFIKDSTDPETGKKGSTFKKLGKQALLGLAAGTAGAALLAKRRSGDVEEFRQRFKSYFNQDK